jgi:uncharacterized membrane protein
MILLAVLFVIIPYLFSFTIIGSDMLKFFYFAVVIFSIISVYCIKTAVQNKFASRLIIILIIISSTFSSFLTLTNSILNKEQGYSISDYKSGTWIRNSTPQRSVFVTMPTIHCAPTDIGGRLRIISYINWPYSHGFNAGIDNVFSRVDDVTHVYETGDIGLVKSKYGARYVFYGSDEKGQFPGAGKLFDKNVKLKTVYSHDTIKIYEIL